MEYQKITPEQIEQYREDGYVFMKNLFSKEEVDLLLKTAKSDHALLDHALPMDDGAGGVSLITGWFIPGDDIYGLFARCPRVVDTTEKLIGREVYHYHSKMLLKEPRTGGAWQWHQDYGYWYNAGYLFSDMLSAVIAVDRASKENGCLQVLRGSHKMGRIDHNLVGEQTGAVMSRVEKAKERFELVYCEMEPGSVLFFHSNTLHCSARNESEYPRWSLICCYTATDNTPFNEPHHPGYEKLKKVPDSAILEAGARPFSESDNPVFAGKNPKLYAGEKK